MRVVGFFEKELAMMTEVQFLNRFQRQSNGDWSCTNPININGPSGAVMISEGTLFSPGALFMGLDLARGASIRWLRSIIGLPRNQPKGYPYRR
jgi:hypothetical protein